MVTATAITSPGFTFSGWTGLPACGTALVCTITMPASSVSLTANFQPTGSGTYQLRTLAAPSMGGTVTAPNPAGYAAGAAVSLTATPAAGYVVDSWFGAACINQSGTTCSFTMPAKNADVFVRFKQTGGSGYTITTDASLNMIGGGESQAAGMIAFSPGQGRVPAGTPVTLTAYTANGYRLHSLNIGAGGQNRNALCPGITGPVIKPWQTPTCTFTMPAEDLQISAHYEAFPDHFALDLAPTPAQAGTVTIMTADGEYNYESYLDESVTPPMMMVQGGLQTTLTAVPLGARQFIRWANGPCSGSTDPVCSFTMPNSATVSNPVFSEAASVNCVAQVTRRQPSFVLRPGGSLVYDVQVPAGCDYSAVLFHDFQIGELQKQGSVVTLAFPGDQLRARESGFVSFFAAGGLEVFPFFHVPEQGMLRTELPPVAFDSQVARTGELPLVTRRITLINNGPTAQVELKVLTTGPFAVAGTTCTSTLLRETSCTIDLQYVPVKPGNHVGEFMVMGPDATWHANLSGTAVAYRENVAAASTGATIQASSRQDAFRFGEAALINGDLRGEPFNAQGYWAADGPSQTLEVRFAAPRRVDRVDLIAYDHRSLFVPLANWQSYGRANPQAVPSPDVDLPADSIDIQSFTVESWNGQAWVPVTETARVDAPRRWLQVGFAPVQTDRVRLTVRGSGQRPLRATEVMVWGEPNDDRPDAFQFPSKTRVPPNTLVRSDAIVPTGFNVPVPVQVASGAYSVGCTSSFVTTPGVLAPGESICVRHTSGPAGKGAQTSLTLGGVSGSFQSQSDTSDGLPPDSTPNPVAAQVLRDVQKGSVVNFAPITLSGVNMEVPASISGGVFSPGCTGSYTAEAVLLVPGQTVCVRHTAAQADNASVTTVLTLNSVSASFTSVTRSGSGTVVTVTPVVGPGWNLLGNGLDRPLSVATALANSQVVTSVWSWDAQTDRWLFYTPQLDSAALAAYAAARGHGVLSEIQPGQGYWVNARVQATLPVQTGLPVTVNAAQLLSGWNLVATGNNPTPAAFVGSQGAAGTPPTGQGVVSLWAWDNQQQKWFLFVPDLNDRGLLQQYLNGRGYLDFTLGGRTLSPGSGFWVNRQ